MLDPYSEPAADCARERYRDLLKEIELEQLLNEVQPRRTHVHERMLLAIGNIFVALGSRLQELSQHEPDRAHAV
ncbi:MAG: hypothetical protein LC737_02280 [Chloroflexi bacterium]|nr:hypothetical protein [Chloroflexota bacterium]